LTWSTRRYSFAGFVVIVALILGMGVWGSQASLAGAVIAQGRVEVEARSQVVQHPDGGIVRTIAVRDGDTVARGQPLILLDGSELESQKAILGGQLTEFRARAARLKAERDGADAVAVPEDLVALGRGDPATAEAVASEVALFNARLGSLKEAVSSYDEQSKQVETEIDGQIAQVAALADQVDLVGQELASSQALLQKGLLEAPRVLALQRETARLVGTKAETEAAVARNRGRIAQIKVEILRLTAERREQAVTELRDVQSKISELSQQIEAVDLKLSRLALKAPMAGRVHDLKVFSQDAVIRPAEPVLYIIPDNGALTVLAKVDLYHVDSLQVGQVATLRFSSFNARTTPEVSASLVRVGADTSVDERTGIAFYEAELHVSTEELAKLGNQQLVPGMPVEVFIQTEARTPLSYMAKPFTDYFERAFRE
jgi:HlyD family secretion protein